MIRILYALSTLGIILLGLAHAILTFVRYQSFSAEAFWFFSAGLALLFAGVTNILHYQLQSPLTFTCALLVNILLALFTLTLGIKVPAPTTILVAFFALLMCLTGAFTYRQLG